MSDKLVDAALKSGLVSPEIIQDVNKQLKGRRKEILEAVSTKARLPMPAFYRALAEIRGIPYAPVSMIMPPEDLFRKIPPVLMRRKLVLPIAQKDEQVSVVLADPDDRETIQVLLRIFGENIQFYLSDPVSLEMAINRAFEKYAKKSVSAAPDAAGDVIAYLDDVLNQAYLWRASDIHIEMRSDDARIRFRVDGKLQEFRAGLSLNLGHALLSRIKVLARLDISEKREPQDGAFSYSGSGTARPIDIRVATAPTRFGERATLRLLGLETEALTLPALGFAQRELEKFQRVITRPHGMVLITGPTGSGKTTTLYAVLREIRRDHLNVLTIEDPVEYEIEGVSQMQVSHEGKLTFSKALRSLLRHDPDILMIGEIRDHETADIAMKAAMTGHLVFSTLHTNDAPSAITRLLDLGCEPYLIASTLSAVVAQRLVRCLCHRCKKLRPATEKEELFLKEELEEIYESVGCPSCFGLGYKGRTALFELLLIDQGLSDLISKKAEQRELIGKAKEKGFVTLRMDGLEKVMKGLTTISEVRAVTVDGETS